MSVVNDEPTNLVLHTVTVLAVLCLLTGCLAKAQAKSDRERDHLSGPVHIVRTENILLPTEAEKTTDEKKEITQVSYAQDGNKTEEVKYEPNGSLLSKTVFSYDGTGKLIEVTTYKPDG